MRDNPEFFKYLGDLPQKERRRARETEADICIRLACDRVPMHVQAAVSINEASHTCDSIGLLRENPFRDAEALFELITSTQTLSDQEIHYGGTCKRDNEGVAILTSPDGWHYAEQPAAEFRNVLKIIPVRNRVKSYIRLPRIVDATITNHDAEEFGEIC
jgi:hypothetical protein